MLIIVITVIGQYLVLATSQSEAGFIVQLNTGSGTNNLLRQDHINIFQRKVLLNYVWADGWLARYLDVRMLLTF